MKVASMIIFLLCKIFELDIYYILFDWLILYTSMKI